MPDLKHSMNTPAMRQFREIKEKHPDAILFFRMGDFYEMFGDDAIIASGILDIALTKRQNEIPMCGIPYHAADNYISRLINAGRKVVMCEQIKSDDPSSKLLRREVVRVISPGTLIEENLMKGFDNNFLCLILIRSDKIYLMFADISTGEMIYSEYFHSDKSSVKVLIEKLQPSEFLVYKEHIISYENLDINTSALITLLNSEDLPIPEELNEINLKEIIKKFLFNSIKDSNFEFSNTKNISRNDSLQLDANTIRNLDLIENQNTNEKSHSLFHTLNKCKTSGGKRFLKNKILFPEIEENLILKHQSTIKILFENKPKLNLLSSLLSDTVDLERIINRFRISSKALPRDFKSIIKTIDISIEMKNLLNSIELNFNFNEINLLKLKKYLTDRLHDGELPAILGSGKFIKDNFNERLDKAREAKSKGKDWILELENREKVSTSLSTLKIKYNKVVGYYIELSRKDATSAPSSYLKKQTLVNLERFTIPELEELERTILKSDEIIDEIEKEEFGLMISEVIKFSSDLISLANEISRIDYHNSLVTCKIEYDWVLPEINKEGNLVLEDSRHPVVEAHLDLGEVFTKNSIYLDRKDSAIAILTGPNMAGKSTFMRQLAIIQILFQMGSFVPAKSASLSICDRIFTRIGSGDNLTKGESTFYVEMKESAEILNNRTEDSLILFDEIGRGTSTYDGMSLAWAIVEHLSKVTHNEKRTKTLFATHYHEITELEKEYGVFNLYLDTQEKQGEVIFLKKVRKGRAKKSFGIYVAKIAGIPTSIVDRAAEILNSMESNKKQIKVESKENFLFPIQPVSPPEWIRIRNLLNDIDPNELSPREAWELLSELKTISKTNN